MSVNINGSITFFVRFFGEGENKRITASTTLRRNWGDEADPEMGAKSIDIEFGRKNFKPEQIEGLKEDVAYTMEVQEGFLSLKRYKRKGSRDYTFDFILHVVKAHITKATAVDVAKRKQALEEAKAKRGGVDTPESPMGIDKGFPF